MIAWLGRGSFPLRLDSQNTSNGVRLYQGVLLPPFTGPKWLANGDVSSVAWNYHRGGPV